MAGALPSARSRDLPLTFLSANILAVRIGNLEISAPLALAPMAGWTDLACRLMAKAHGAGLVYTEMVSAEGIIRRDPRTWAYVRSHPAERPLAVQLFGGEPEAVAKAAGIIEAAGFEAIDLNLGCPVKKVIRQGAGAALLNDLSRAATMFKKVRATVSIPVTAKLRTGWSPETGPVGLEAARLAEEEGFDGLAFHPRYASQGFGGTADWRLLAEAVSRVRIPVWGSGDVTGPDQAGRMIEETGCAGVMIGRAALGRPWIFEQSRAFLAGDQPRPVSLAKRRRAVERHFGLLLHYAGPKLASLKFKGLAPHYFKGLPEARLARRAIHQANGVEEMVNIIRMYFKQLEEREGRE